MDNNTPDLNRFVLPSLGAAKDPRLLIPEPEAAHRIGGLCLKSMFNLRKRGELPFVKVGSRVMYRPGDLEAWVARQTGGQVRE